MKLQDKRKLHFRKQMMFNNILFYNMLVTLLMSNYIVVRAEYDS